MRTYKARGIVLRRDNFGEADRKVTLYTDRFGKIILLAKGARRPTGKLTGAVNLFNEIDFVAAKGRSFDILTEATVIYSRYGLAKDFLGLKDAFWIGELVDRLVPEREKNSKLYRLLSDILRVIEQKKTTKALDYFIYHALLLLGYKPELNKCVECGEELQAGDKFSFHPIEGGIIGTSCHPSGGKKGERIDINTIKALRFLEKSWQEVEKIRLPPKTAKDLHFHLKNLVEAILQKPVKTDRI